MFKYQYIIFYDSNHSIYDERYNAIKYMSDTEIDRLFIKVVDNNIIIRKRNSYKEINLGTSIIKLLDYIFDENNPKIPNSQIHIQNCESTLMDYSNFFYGMGRCISPAPCWTIAQDNLEILSNNRSQQAVTTDKEFHDLIEKYCNSSLLLKCDYRKVE